MKHFPCTFRLFIFLNAFGFIGNLPQSQAASPSIMVRMLDQQTAQLSWTNLPSGFSLEEADALSPTNSWQSYIQGPSLQNNQFFVTVIVAPSTNRFFRLRQTSVGGLPPDPGTVAPPLDTTVATDFTTATAFLYSSGNPIQTGVTNGTIQPQRASVIRGKVLTRDGATLSGVRITVLGHPEFGQTLSRADGAFDLAVNGGGQLTVRYEKDGFLAAQRAIVARWRDYAWMPDIIMIPFDTAVTTVDLGVAAMQVARGSAVSDTDGVRRATILFPQGTTAGLIMPNGTTQTISSLNIRAREFTVGTNGPAAMPANLPPSSGYTYCVELSADEAVAAGASDVRFSQALPVYVENFLDFPVGTAVPTGYYDRQKGQWIASANGRVIKVLNITGGLADLDTDGDAAADDAAKLTALGVTSEERARLADLYTSGQTLWRVPITHFTPWDCNWPYGPPSDATSPPGQNQNNPAVNYPDEECGSIIGCQYQTLGESVSVTGTPWRLHYQSGRTLGRKEAYTVDIPLSGATIPASLRAIRVEVSIAGRLYQQSFAPAPNLAHTVIWDGLDGYGRPLQGAQDAAVQVHYDYVPQYYGIRSDFANSFARADAAGVAVSGSRMASTITISKAWAEQVGAWDARALGLGGWSLSVQHAYDPASQTLLLGNGRQRRAEAMGWSVTTVAGNGDPGFSGDGGQATSAGLGALALAVGPDGSLFIADKYDNRIRRVGPDGIISTVAGNGARGYSGDGGPATAAALYFPEGVAVGPDGTLFIADDYNRRVRRVSPDGVISTVAGNGGIGFSGDGGPATAAAIRGPIGVAVGGDGSLFIVNIGDSDFGDHRVRRVGPDGIINTVAGNGSLGFSGDGGPAASASLYGPQGIAMGSDGSLFIADSLNHRIRRVGPDGIITTVAGTGASGFSGDGGPATAAALDLPTGVAVGSDGSLFIADKFNNRIRRVGPDGIISTVVGKGSNSFSGDGGPATAATLYFPQGVAVGPDGSLFVVDSGNSRIRRVRPALPDFAASNVLLASEDGREVYFFNSSGRHLKTLDALTGAMRYQFGYNSSGYLTSITNGSGNVSTIERTGATPTAIVGYGGQRTALQVGADGWLLTATNPAAETHTMGYSAEGLLRTFTDPSGNLHRYTYDPLGRLIKDEDPGGGSTTLSRTEQTNGYTVTTTSALGRVRAYQMEQLPAGDVRRTVTANCCGQTVRVIGTDGSEQTTNSDGSVITMQYGPDPRFGMVAPRLLKRVRTVPGGQMETVTSQRTVTMADPNNLLSLQAMTDIVSVNGRVFTRSYDAATRTMTETSAESRRIVSVLDAQGRVIRQELAPGIAPITVTYDSRGRVIENRQGTEAWTYVYDARNRVVARTNAAGLRVSFLYDDADRITRKTLPSGAAYQFTYDANGNRTEVMLPSGARHSLGYTPKNLDASYTPPNNGSYLRTFNVDGRLTRTTLPGGRVMDWSYDAFSRVTGTSYPEAVTDFEYLPNDFTERLARIANTPVSGPAQDIAYSYNGSLVSGMTASGVAPAQISYSYDNGFFPTNMILVSGTDTVQSALRWDRDGLASGFGPFTFTRGGPRGALSGVSDAASTASYGYDNLGRISTRDHQVNVQASYAMQLSYDTVGRITRKTERASGTTHTNAYAYDLNGQLIEVTRDNIVSERYVYDLNGNRTSRQLDGGAVEAASYDSQDRLIQRGAVAYQFNADGFLTQRGADTFQYNTRGQLLGATVGGQAITYGYDGLGRRVSRTDPGGTYRYLYGDPASHLVTAMRGPTNELTTLFYDTAGFLIALERGGVRYYVATDQVGTPRVVSSSTGTLVKVVDYDSFGNVKTDSNSAFELPIGFAGGLADTVSGLVHFGFRDYDPVSGNWTARDPVLFGGGQGNLYGYVRNNPVSNRDPLGLFCVNFTVYDVVGGGFSYCLTDDGVSLCGEIGLGVGVSVGVDHGGGLEEPGTQLVGELSYEVGPVEFGVGGSLDNKGCLKFSPKGQIGPVTLEPGKVGLDSQIEDWGKIGAGAEAKIAAKGCVQAKF